ncbi:hypothetical protein [Allosediminivita pacifica]|nr:hypothetical protein [Allosediminivita pacifica]GGB04462.1 hypothetical protein GCM10011324_13320 [Allosediminivita pacifica]
MTFKTVLAALALAFVPVIGSAACYGAHEEQVSTCADGMTYDTAQGACVVIAS